MENTILPATHIISRTGRSLLVFGILQLLLAPLACLPALILNDTGNRYAQAESPVYLVLGGFFFVMGFLLAISGIFTKRKNLWAMILCIVVLVVQLLVAMLLILTSLMDEMDPKGISAGVILSLVSILFIINVGRSMMALSALKIEIVRGFSPVMPVEQAQK